MFSRLTLLTLSCLVAAGPAMAIEEPDFELLAQADGYEVRRYSPYIVAEVEVSGRSSDSQGFRTLAGYIFGDNVSGEKMKMTAPVESSEAGNGGTTFGFVMEDKYSLETLPKPSNERIRIREKPPVVVAVRRFSGRWTDKNFEKNEKKLLDALARDSIDVAGKVMLARYNGPMTPWFMRRNELIVPVQWPSN